MPARATHSEEMLQGKALSPELVEAAAEAAIFGALPMKNNEYKTALTVSVVARAITAAATELPSG